MTRIVNLAVVRADNDADVMPAHPVADAFPMIEGAEFDALVADIKEHGQREAIVVHDGQILDGRNRYRACRQVGIVPRFVQWDQHGTVDAFVVSLNLRRRHLNERQRAMIGARLVNIRQGEVGKNHPKSETVITVSDAAALMKVDKSMVDSARVILARGTPEDIAAADAGKVGVDPLARRIRGTARQKKPKGKRDAALSQTGHNPERIQRLKMNADVWAKVGGALDALTAMPLPADVAGIIAGHPKRRLHAADKIARALQWLGEFAKAYDALTNGRSNADACNRD